MEFKKVKLRELSLRITKGTTPNKEAFKGSDVTYIKSDSLNFNGFIDKKLFVTIDEKTHIGKLKRSILKEDDILYSIAGAYLGKVGIVKKEYLPANTNQAVGIISLNNNIVFPKYIYYYLQLSKIRYFANNSISQSAQPNINLEQLGDFDINICELEEQKKIVFILDSITRKIELNNLINDNLYNQAVVIYNDKFGCTSQENYSIGDYLVPKRGKNLLSRDAVLGDVPVIAGGLEPATYHNVSNTNAPVITISASGANAGYINLWNVPVWSSDSSYIDKDITNNVYFWYVTLKTRQKEIFDAQTGSAQPHIYPQHIAQLPMSKLEDKDILKYEKQVEPFFKMIGKNKEENKYLETLRDTLLPKLMNGEIDLSNIKG